MQMPKLPSPFHINTMKEMEAIAYEVFQKTSTKTRAIAVFQISGLTGQEQAKQSKTLKSVTALLSIGLGGECIIGQYAQERLIMLLPDIGSQDCLRRKVEEALTFVRRVMKKDEVSESIRFIVGIAVQRQGETGYGTLLTSALRKESNTSVTEVELLRPRMRASMRWELGKWSVSRHFSSIPFLPSTESISTTFTSGFSRLNAR